MLRCLGTTVLLVTTLYLILIVLPAYRLGLDRSTVAELEALNATENARLNVQFYDLYGANGNWKALIDVATFGTGVAIQIVLVAAWVFFPIVLVVSWSGLPKGARSLWPAVLVATTLVILGTWPAAKRFLSWFAD